MHWRLPVGTAVCRAFDNACVEVDIEGLVPRSLRRTTASLAICADANVKVVQRRLGQATSMTRDRYGHLVNDDLAGVADALVKAVDSTAVSLRYSGSSTETESPKVRPELQSPHSPIGRGSGLKIRTVSVRVRLGAQ